MLITEHVALKVGQQEGDLHPQSQLEPWRQIKRFTGCRRWKHGLRLPALSHSQIHINMQYELVCIMCIIHLYYFVLAQLNVTV